ncbi:MAG: YgiQ family radical SAM protein, partial [Desulfobacteraceae bacterium]|nr:YgiQ family radical SAM protein [Desulfobacteraceae bacterium]
MPLVLIMKHVIQTPTFIPTTAQEVQALGWKHLDVILVTGDAYIDASHIGVAVIGRVLLDAGYRVGIIAQPDIQGDRDIARLGEPELFWGVTAGCIDSMIANYTASSKRRKSDDLTPGGLNTKRPDRAVIIYCNLIRRFFKQTRPIVLGGVEASLRRISHYDAGSDSVRRSILFDAKADILVYGMAEQSILEIAQKFKRQEDIRSIRGICYISRQFPEAASDFEGPDIELPDHDKVSRDKELFSRMFKAFYENADPFTAKRLCQRQDTRYLVHNPPQFPLSSDALDRIYELPYTRDVHPFYKKQGQVTALDTIRFSLTTHRGCYGECRFCAITVHQGRHVVSRSEASLLREAATFMTHP